MHVQQLVYAVLVAVIMTTFVLVSVHLASPDSGTPDNVHCDDGLECTLDRLRSDGTCTHPPLSTKTSCSECYATNTGHCDGKGACAGAAEDCLGWCNATSYTTGIDCDNQFKWNEGWIDSWDYYAHTTRCFANRCTGAFSFFTTYYGYGLGQDVETGSFDTSVVQCKDLLDPEWYAANGTCITMERFVIAEPDEGNEGVHVCYYYWNCGVFDKDWLLTYQDD